jgi:hypothetical protein
VALWSRRVEVNKSEKKVSEDGIAQVTEMMPCFEGDFVAYEDMKAYLIDEDADLRSSQPHSPVQIDVPAATWRAHRVHFASVTPYVRFDDVAGSASLRREAL